MNQLKLITLNNIIKKIKINKFSTLIPFQFKELKSGKIIKVNAAINKSLLEISIENNVDIEGACGGEMACSTCHVILSNKLFNVLPEKKEEEEDMLDLAVGVKETSRLGCQCKVNEHYRNEEIIVPADSISLLSK